MLARKPAFRPQCEQLEAREVPATIRGNLYEDLAGNGTRDPGDPNLSLAGATVYLDLNGNGVRDAGDVVTTTDATGAYEFTGLAPGTYAVRHEGPAGHFQTDPAPDPGPGALGDVTGILNPAVTASAFGLQWANGNLYVAYYQETLNGTVTWMVRTDPVTGASLSSFVVPAEFYDLAFDGTAFWGSVKNSQQLIQFDTSGAILGTVPIPFRPEGIAWDGDSLRVFGQNAGVNGCYDIDPVTGAVLGSLPLNPMQAFGEAYVLGLEFDGRHLWAAAHLGSTLYEIDPTSGAVLRSFDTPGSFQFGKGWGLAFDGQQMWVSRYDQNSWGPDAPLFRLDVSTPGGHTVELTTAGQVAAADFGDFRLGTTTGRVFRDQNSNGTQDPGEAGLEGWLVFRDLNGNGVRDGFWEPWTTTDAGGNFTLGGLRAGTHDVQVELRAPGYSATTALGGSVSITASNQTLSAGAFGVRQDGLAPVGAETQVNQTTTGLQATAHTDASFAVSPSTVVADGQGNYVAVWTGEGPGDTSGVFARVFNANGTPRTNEFRVNVTTAGDQDSPKVAMASLTGQFVVTWYDRVSQSVRARLFNPDGTARGGEFIVYSSGTEIGHPLSVGMDKDGDFVVAYARSKKPSGFSTWPGPATYYVQRCSAAGAAQGQAIKLGQTAWLNATSASVAMGPEGNFVAAWQEMANRNDSWDTVFVQRFTAAGKADGSRVKVAGGSTRAAMPTVALDPTGAFAVAWAGDGGRDARVFNASGTARSPVIRYETGHITFPAPVVLTPTELVVCDSGATARRYTWDGVAIGPAFSLSTTRLGGERTSLAVTPTGFVAVWFGAGPGDNQGVFFQRFATP